MKKEGTADELWEKFLDFVEDNSTKYDGKVFSGLMVFFLSKMIFDTAPTIEEAKEVFNNCINEGLKWSIEDKENDK